MPLHDLLDEPRQRHGLLGPVHSPPAPEMAAPLSIHSRMYAGQLRRLVPVLSHLARKEITFWSTSLTPLRSRQTARPLASSRRKLSSSPRLSASIRPLSLKILDLS